jgi:hypothetical protein
VGAAGMGDRIMSDNDDGEKRQNDPRCILRDLDLYYGEADKRGLLELFKAEITDNDEALDAIVEDWFEREARVMDAH